MFADSSITVPGSDTARQDALNGASVEVGEGLRDQAEFLQHPGVVALLCLLHHTVWVYRPFQVVSAVHAEGLEAFHPVH